MGFFSKPRISEQTAFNPLAQEFLNEPKRMVGLSVPELLKVAAALKGAALVKFKNYPIDKAIITAKTLVTEAQKHKCFEAFHTAELMLKARTAVDPKAASTLSTIFANFGMRGIADPTLSTIPASTFDRHCANANLPEPAHRKLPKPVVS